jgi:hypothetical protein
MGSEFSQVQGRAVQKSDQVSVDYYAILSRAVEASKDNPGQVRGAIYDLARSSLHREILWQNPSVSDEELHAHTLALEDAIKRVEAEHSVNFDNHVFRAGESAGSLEPPRVVELQSDPEPAQQPEPSAETSTQVVILAPEPPMAMQSGPMLRSAPDIVVDYHPPSRDVRHAPEPPGRIRNGIGSFVQLTGAALLAVAIFAVMTGQLDIRWLGHKQQQAAIAPPAPSAVTPAPVAAVPAIAAPAPPPFPLPATYGVYAVNNDKLVELEKFAIRVPDPRVLISPEIREPSRITLPDGKVSFVVFRRELANGAPEKVAVRVVAKIAREMTFTDGKASTSNVENLWRIRNNAFDFRVSPFGDNRDLIVIKPDADFVFPAGRYALVLNGQGYDFSVAGPITSPLQCLERIETLNGAIYSECRNPKVN